MTQQPFSRPGAIDLSGLGQRPTPGAPATGTSAGQAEAAPGGATSAYAVRVGEENFQATIEASMTAPVLLVFFSPTRSPESSRLAEDTEALSGEFEGRFLVGLVDIDASPQIAQAMQIPSVPLVVAVIDGRPMPLLQEAVPLEELRAALTQVVQQLTTQGITGRHQPRSLEPAAEGEGEEQPAVDPRYAAAQAALEADDVDTAVAEYQKLLVANPADAEAAAGLAMAMVLQRTRGVDLQQAREAAATSPDDVAAQTLVADLDLLGGHVDDAFTRLVELVRRTSGDDRDAVREHLLGLFGAVGNDDARVLRGRQGLASALF